jgi:hypothetical protein
MGAAIEGLQGEGLTIGPVTKEGSSSAPDTVLGQEPRPGTLVVRGTRVAMVVAEVLPLEVPNLVGLTQVAAFEALRSVGLEPGRVTERTSSAPEGTVVQHAPSAGTAVPPGSAVELFVAAPSTLAPWVLGIAGLALTAGVAGVAGYRIARRVPASADVRPHLDVGLQELDPDEEGLMRSEVRLGASLDSGDQLLEPADIHVVSEYTEGE